MGRRAWGQREHPDYVGAKHSGEESLGQNQQLIIRMLRPHQGSCQNGMLQRAAGNGGMGHEALVGVRSET